MCRAFWLHDVAISQAECKEKVTGQVEENGQSISGLSCMVPGTSRSVEFAQRTPDPLRRAHTAVPRSPRVT
jgi:hypothetical protein